MSLRGKKKFDEFDLQRFYDKSQSVFFHEARDRSTKCMYFCAKPSRVQFVIRGVREEE